MEGRITPRTEAVEMLENYIKTNHLPANFRIPSERELCDMWGMNRTTLRFAVDILIDKGKLYRKKGSGTYISEPKLVRDLQGVNALSAYLRQQGISFATKVLSLRTIECNKQISRKLEVPLGHKIYELIRLRVVDGQPCIIETMYINSSLVPDFEQYNLEKSSINSIFTNIYKFKLAIGEEKISVTYTTSEEAELLDIKEGDPVFFATGVTKTKTGLPIEYYKALFRADRFKFVSTIREVSQ